MKKQIQLILFATLFMLLTMAAQGQVGSTFLVRCTWYEITSTPLSPGAAPRTVTAINFACEITGPGVSTWATIPETVRHAHGASIFTVTAIGNDAYRDKQFTGTRIPKGVTHIGSNAFRNNQLTKVIFSPQSTLTHIGVAAFLGNQLTSIEIPNSVSTIGANAFTNNLLTEVTILDGVTSIEDWAFANNPNLSWVRVEASNPPGLGNNVFTLTSGGNTVDRKGEIDLIVPEGTVQAYLDAGWTGFKSISAIGETFVDNYITYQITSLEPFEVMTTGYNTAGGPVVNIPSTVDHGPTYTVTEIGASAFSNKGLTEVTIPEGVTDIRNQAFAGNPLDLVTVEANTPPTLGSTVFSSRTEINLILPGGTIQAYEDAGWTGFKSITDEDYLVTGDFKYKVTSLPGQTNYVTLVAYNNSTNTTSVHIPEQAHSGITSYRINAIGDNAFQDAQITNITMSHEMRRIGKYALAGNMLSSIIIREGVTSIGEGALSDNDLTVVIIPSNVTEIGKDAFKNNPNLSLIRLSPPPLGAANASPQAIEGGGNDPFNNANRNQIHLIVPENKRQEYEAAGWTGFKNYSTIEDIVDGDFKYTITSIIPHEVSVSDYNGASKDIEIKDKIKINGLDFSVTALGVRAFREKGLTAVTIPNTVISIRASALSDNQLTSINIPGSVENIGVNAFANNKLEEVTLPGSVKNMDRQLFDRNQLKRVVIEEGITYITEGSFAKNASLKYVKLPESLHTIHASAFSTNENLASIIIPKNVKEIRAWAFSLNIALQTVVVQATTPPEFSGKAHHTSLTSIESIKTQVFTKRVNRKIEDNRGNIDLIVPPGTVAAYQDHPVWGGFKSIKEPAGINDTFTANDITYQITSLSPNREVRVHQYIGTATDVIIPQTVDYEANTYTVTAIGEDTDEFDSDSPAVRPFMEKGLTSVKIPNTVTIIGLGAFNINSLAEVTIPNSVTTIRRWAFSRNDLTEVTIPANVERIGQGAFFQNRNLKLVTVEAISPPTLHTSAFQETSPSQIVIVPEVAIDEYKDPANGWTGFKSIGFDTFTDNHIKYLASSSSPPEVEIIAYDNDDSTATVVNIPSDVRYKGADYDVVAIRNDAFKEKGLTELRFADQNKVTSIGQGAFRNNQLTGVMTLPDKLESIGDDAFRDNQLTGVTIPNSVTSIGNGAFAYNQLTGVMTLPNNLKSIGGESFRDNQLTEVILPNSMTSIGWRAFMYNQLTQVTIPSNVTHIEGDAFADNELTEVTFSTSGNLKTINSSAFKVNKLTRVTIPEGVESIELSAFSANDELAHVTLPGSVKTIGPHAFDRMPPGGTVRLEGTEPPSIEESTFRRFRIDLDIPRNRRQVYLDAGWTGFRSMGIFTDKDFKYGINATTTNEVMVVDYTGSAAEVDIPGTVEDNNETYTVTSIGQYAFKDYAFNDNDSTSVVTIPEGVTRIDSVAFMESKLAMMIMEANTPPRLHAHAFQGSTIHNIRRGHIDVIVPRGTPAGSIQAAYETEWIGETESVWTNKFAFGSITEGIRVSIEGAPPGIASLSPFDITFQFAREVTGFTEGDISVNHATLSDFTEDGSSYTVKVTPATCEGVIEITVPEDVAEYAPGFLNVEARATIAVKAAPSAPTVSSPSVEYCVGETATALTATGDNLSWYTSETGGTGQATAPTPNTATAGTTFHYVSQRNSNGCESERTEIEVTVNAPSAPSVNSSLVRYCLGRPADALTATGNNLRWYTTPTGGTGEAAAPIPSTATAGTTPYYVSQTTNGCESERAVIVVTVVDACPIAIGDVFTVSGIDYKITSIDPGPNQVKAVDYNGSATAVEIPRTVDDKGETYTITAIGPNAFREKQLTEVTIPNSVTSIGDSAFVDNTDLDLVTVEATHPPSLHENAFTDRGQIDLVVPAGTGIREDYLKEGWTGFASITEKQVVTAIRNYEFNDFTLYPNPARDKVYIDPRPGQELKQVNIYTMIGGYLYSENGPEINTSRLPRGTYLFEIVTQAGDRSMRRVIIQ